MMKQPSWNDLPLCAGCRTPLVEGGPHVTYDGLGTCSEDCREQYHRRIAHAEVYAGLELEETRP